MLIFCPEGWGNDKPQTAQLHFTKLDTLGFHFYYNHDVGDYDSPYYREAELFYACSSTTLETRSAINWAGEERLIFDALFVDTPTAIEIVRQFLKDGERSKLANWTKPRDVRAKERALDPQG
ncbi:MAG: hypothetical protein ACRC8S_13235 [Fimbriiglobus sp.]